MAGSITGQVVDIRNNQPLENVQLQLTPSGGGQTTNDAGQFSFEDVSAGSDYELTATAQGYDEAVYGPLTVVDDVSLSMVLALTPSEY